jgi:hypothetical protein
LTASIAVINSNQLTSGGSSVIVQATGSVVLFNYVLYPGDNASTTANNSIISKTVNVGTDNAASISPNNYHLFIDTSAILCQSDLSVKVRAMGTNGVYSEFSDAEIIYLTPSAPILYGALFLSSEYGYDYNTGGRLSAFFEEDACYADYTIRYNLCVQYQTGLPDGEGGFENQFRVYENLVYDPLTSSIYYDISGADAINYAGIREDTIYIAVQGVRLLESNQEAVGPLSNTLLATQALVPDAPVNLKLNAVNFTGDLFPVPGTVPSIQLQWEAPPGAAVKPITKYYLYRWKNSNPIPSNPTYTIVPNLPLNPGDIQDFQDSNLSSFNINDIVNYLVRSVDDNDSPEEVSSDSNTVKQTWIIPSSAPSNLNVVVLLDKDNSGTQSTNLTVIFNRPDTINGELAPPDDGYNSYDYYQTGGGYFFKIEYQNSLGAWVSLGDFQRDYTDEQIVQENFNDLLLIDEGSTVRVTVNLTTYFPAGLGLELPGFIAGFSSASTAVAGSIPIITDFNGEDGQNQWTKSDNVSSFNIYSYGALKPVLLNAQTNNVGVVLFGIDALNNLPLFEIAPLPVPTLVPDNYYYGEFAGAFKYSFQRTVSNNFLVSTITTSNVNGLATSSSTDN